MKTSARNQFFGAVTGIRTGAVHAEVEIALNVHDHLTAMITMKSLADLQLAPGSAVWTLVKALSVPITPDDPGIRLSARNRLCGTVSRGIRGSVNADVVIDLPGGPRSAPSSRSTASTSSASRPAVVPARCSRPAA